MHMQLPSRKDSNLKNAILKRTPSMLPTTPTRLMSPSTIIGPSVTADDPYLLGTPDANLSLKETWVRNQLNERASEYKQVRKLSVVVGTWNVNQKVPGADCSMEEWLHLDLDPDIIAVGLQEIDMTAQAMIKQETDASVDWVAALDSEIFGAKSRYVRLAEKQLVGMFLTVYVKEKLSTKVRDIKYESLGLGAMGTMGNKGGIGIRFRIFQTTFCFITSHFVPHMGGTPKRNQNFADILSQLDFGGQAKPDSHDYLFWCGDFNYRIDNMESAEVKKLVKAKQFKQLLEHDQLMTERMSGRVFLGFKEGDVTFAPTYKYDVGTLTYDTSEKQRVPSWTDRILWKGKKRDRVRNRHYGRYELLISDHLPVSALFDVEAQTIIEHKYRACRESLGKEYDNEKIDSSRVPSLKLSSEIFYFDNVAYEVPRTETIELVNTGSVVCEYQFVPMEAGQDECCKPWLNISQVQGLVLPNQSVQITLTVLVDQMTAPNLNTTDGTLEDTLLIILENGPSYTVNIRGKFLRTCFGNSLRNLIHIHGPARNMNPDDLTNDQRPRLPIPKEIFKMIDYLSKYALRTPGLLSTPADTKEVDLVRDMMDRGESLSMYNGSPHAVLEGLVHLLESLPQPLIPYKHYKLCIEHHQDVDKLVQDVSKLPPVHYNVFQYLMAFLRELLVHCDANGLTADHISQTCCDAVLRTPLNVPEEQQIKDRYAKIVFIKNFLRDDQELIMNVSKKELFRIT